MLRHGGGRPPLELVSGSVPLVTFDSSFYPSFDLQMFWNINQVLRNSWMHLSIWPKNSDSSSKRTKASLCAMANKVCLCVWLFFCCCLSAKDAWINLCEPYSCMSGSFWLLRILVILSQGHLNPVKFLIAPKNWTTSKKWDKNRDYASAVVFLTST